MVVIYFENLHHSTPLKHSVGSNCNTLKESAPCLTGGRVSHFDVTCQNTLNQTNKIMYVLYTTFSC